MFCEKNNFVDERLNHSSSKTNFQDLDSEEILLLVVEFNVSCQGRAKHDCRPVFCLQFL